MSTIQDNAPLPLFAAYLNNVCIEKDKKNSCCQTTLKVSAIALCTIVGLIGTYPYLLASLNISYPVIKWLSLFGSVIGAGTFMSVNLCKCLNYICDRGTPEERALKNREQILIIRIANFSLSLLCGVVSQSAVLEVSDAFGVDNTLTYTLAGIAWAAASGPATISLLEAIMEIELNVKKNLRICFGNEKARFLQEIKTAMIANLHLNIQKMSSLNEGERKKRFSALYNITNSCEKLNQLKRATTLMKQLFTIKEEIGSLKDRNVRSSSSFTATLPYIIGGSLSLFYLYNVMMLSEGSAEDLDLKRAADYSFAAISGLVWVGFCAFIPGQVLTDIFGKINEVFGRTRENQTFYEEKHPLGSKVTSALSLALAFSIFGQAVVISEQNFNPSKLLGKVGIMGVFLTIAAFFYHSMNEVINKAVEKGYQMQGKEAADLLNLQNKLKDVEDVIKQTSLNDLREMFDILNKKKLVNQILQDYCQHTQKVLASETTLLHSPNLEEV